MTDLWDDEDLDDLPDVNWICFACGDVNPIKTTPERCSCGGEREEN